MVYSTIGTEIEYNLIDADGYIINNAKQILGDSRNDGSFVKEGTNAQIEIVSKPFGTIKELHQDLLRQIKLLENICQDYSSQPIPLSEIGAGKGEFRGMENNSINKGPIYMQLFGKELFEELRAYSGIHLHLSQIPGKELEQFTILQALDPLSFAITSTSPISYKGQNSLSCHRINSFRNNIFDKFPVHGQLQPYPKSVEEIDQSNQERWQQWHDYLMEKGFPTEVYKKLFSPDNTGYAPIRKRDHLGETGTFEVRSFDTTPLDVALSAFALYKGINDRVMNNNAEIIFSSGPECYNFSDQKIILPNYEELKRLSQEAITENNHTKEILKKALEFAREGLIEEDQQYLKRLEDIADHGNNPATEIMQFMRSQGYQGHQFSPEQVAKTNLFMRDRHLQSLEYLN
jgi:gamma-glutamyl:cysteine ligase YbdK (ATP-grasp superfamily)